MDQLGISISRPVFGTRPDLEPHEPVLFWLSHVFTWQSAEKLIKYLKVFLSTLERVAWSGPVQKLRCGPELPRRRARASSKFLLAIAQGE